MELRMLGKIREQCGRLYDMAKSGKLLHFTLDESKIPAAVDATEKTIRQHYPNLNIPRHSRLRHFGDDRVASLLKGWHCDATEKARRLVDLVTVSVLLDAGAGLSWNYVTKDDQTLSASEGLARGTLDMFLAGMFSSDPAFKPRVNSHALRHLSTDAFAQALQVTPRNKLVGLEGRVQLLSKLGAALEANPEIFGSELGRPGNMVDYLLGKAEGKKVALQHLWQCCSEGLASIWPVQANGLLVGDIWRHSLLKTDAPGSDLVPFHKLSQWLVYSLMDTLELVLDIQVSGAEQLTCLAEYRNGGLFMDTGVLELRDPQWKSRGEVNVGTELVVEWRALTVALVDKVAEEIRRRLGRTAENLSLSQILEGGTWRAGRELARKLRPDGSSPLSIRSDGTVF